MRRPVNPDPFPILPADFGRYRLLHLLGRGGMGAVYLAEDTQLGRQVAVKIPFLGVGESRQRVERFVREARSAAALHHPNICTVFDAGEIDGRPFIAMAYIPGTSLEAGIDPAAPFPQRRAAEIARKVALALAAAHRSGTVHRDLKPANVILTAEGEPVITDFGLAKRFDDTGASSAGDDVLQSGATGLTRDGGIVGTPGYMAPEQVRGDGPAVGPATDVYSLGVVLFEMLTGRAPYTGGLQAVLGQVLAAPVPPVSEFRPDVDARLDAVCRKAMAKAPAERFAGMAELVAALDGFLTAPETATPASDPLRPSGLRRAATVAAGLFVAVAGCSWAAAVLLRGEPPTGVLAVEPFDDETAARFPNARVLLTGPDGGVRYALAATEQEKKLAPGSYRVVIESAEGVTADPAEITVKKGTRAAVRLKAPPAAPPRPVFGPEQSEWAGVAVGRSSGTDWTNGIAFTITERRDRDFKAVWRTSSGRKHIIDGTLDADGRLTVLGREKILPSVEVREPLKGSGEVTSSRMTFSIEAVDGSSTARLDLKRLPAGGEDFEFVGRWRCYHRPRVWEGVRRVTDASVFIDFNGRRCDYERDGGLLLMHFRPGLEWLVIDPDNPNELHGSNGPQTVTWVRQ